MIKWCSSFWKQRKARLPDCIRILSVRRNAAIFQKERIALGQMAFRRERRSLRLPGPRGPTKRSRLAHAQKSILPFYHLKSEVVLYPPKLSERNRQGSEVRARWAGVETQVLTEGTLAALAKGVKGTKTSQTWDCSAAEQLGNLRANLHEEVNH